MKNYFDEDRETGEVQLLENNMKDTITFSSFLSSWIILY